MISKESYDKYPSIHPFIIPVCCDHKSSLLLTICSEDTWENPHSLWIQQGDIDLIKRDQLSPNSLRTKSKTQITIDSNKKAPTHFPSGTNPKMQWKTVQLSWKINYCIICSQKTIQIFDWRENDLWKMESTCAQRQVYKVFTSFLTLTFSFVFGCIETSLRRFTFKLITSYIINYLIVFTSDSAASQNKVSHVNGRVSNSSGLQEQLIFLFTGSKLDVSQCHCKLPDSCFMLEIEFKNEISWTLNKTVCKCVCIF